MSIEALAAQRSQKQSELSANQAGLSTVETKLEQVKQAKLEIANLKDDAQTIKSKLSRIEYADPYHWYGENFYKFESDYVETDYKNAKQYYKDLDMIADQLVDAERKLNDEKHDYCIIIEQLHDFISWIGAEIEKLLN